MKVLNYWNVLAGISNNYHLFALNKLNLNRNFIYFEMNMAEVQKQMDFNLMKINLTESDENQSNEFDENQSNEFDENQSNESEEDSVF